MTATQDKWGRLPNSSDVNGSYWACNNLTWVLNLATVKQDRETERYTICIADLGVVTTHHSVSTFIRDHDWMRIEKPNIASPGWIDEIPNKSAYYWACNIETQEVFAAEVSWLSSVKSLRVYLPERGLVSDGSAFLRDHRWLEIEEPILPGKGEEVKREREKEEIRAKEVCEFLNKLVDDNAVEDIFM